MHNFWAQNGPFLQMRIHAYLHAKKSDINLLVKYLQLKNTEISLADSHFGCNLRTRFFASMQLMNHKNFNLTQIPDKTTDVIYLKSPKTMFWDIFDHFWSFLSDGIFSKKSGCHTIYGPLKPC